MNDLGKLGWALSLHAAVERFDELRTQEAITERSEPGLRTAESLELLALSEFITRKLRYVQQLSVRTVRTDGTSWADISRSLGVSRQAAWDSHRRWIDGQEAQHFKAGAESLDSEQIAQTRTWAGVMAD